MKRYEITLGILIADPLEAAIAKQFPDRYAQR
jgi:hypothetical protein